MSSQIDVKFAILTWVKPRIEVAMLSKSSGRIKALGYRRGSRRGEGLSGLHTHKGTPILPKNNKNLDRLLMRTYTMRNYLGVEGQVNLRGE